MSNCACQLTWIYLFIYFWTRFCVSKSKNLQKLCRKYALLPCSNKRGDSWYWFLHNGSRCKNLEIMGSNPSPWWKKTRGQLGSRLCQCKHTGRCKWQVAASSNPCHATCSQKISEWAHRIGERNLLCSQLPLELCHPVIIPPSRIRVKCTISVQLFFKRRNYQS